MTNNGKPRPFMFTRWLATRREVSDWLGHFEKKGIPAGIVSRNRHPAYAVWRVGVESDNPRGDRIDETLRVEVGVHGFAKIFNQHKKEGRK